MISSLIAEEATIRFVWLPSFVQDGKRSLVECSAVFQILLFGHIGRFLGLFSSLALLFSLFEGSVELLLTLVDQGGSCADHVLAHAGSDSVVFFVEHGTP